MSNLLDAGADSILRKQFKKHFTNHECNFPPTRPISLGDFGVIQNGYFQRLGNIQDDFGINFTAIIDDTPTHEQFTSQGNVDLNLVGKGELNTAGVPVAKASLEVKFSSQKGVFFSSAEVRYNQIGNLREVGNEILTRYNNGRGEWRKDYVLVSRVLEGRNSVLVVSGSNSSGCTIEASSPAVERLNLGDASAGIQFKTESNLSYRVITPDAWQIGFGLSGVRDSFFHQPIFRITSTGRALAANNGPVNPEAVVFGDITTTTQA